MIVAENNFRFQSGTLWFVPCSLWLFIVPCSLIAFYIRVILWHWYWLTLIFVSFLNSSILSLSLSLISYFVDKRQIGGLLMLLSFCALVMPLATIVGNFGPDGTATIDAMENAKLAGAFFLFFIGLLGLFVGYMGKLWLRSELMLYKYKRERVHIVQQIRRLTNHFLSNLLYVLSTT